MIMLGIVARREIARAREVASREPVRLSDHTWRMLAQSGHRVGPERAAVTVVEFVDFQCPSCERFAKVIAGLRHRYPNDLAVVYRHLPLPYHKHAYAAARAAECAADQGRFEAFHDALFANQGGLDTVGWTALARTAQVHDLVAFETCRSRDDSVSAIQADVVAASRLGATHTPTVVVNGWWIRGGVPRAPRMDSIVRAELVTRKP
jgi:protein-disulfide isomerase